MKLYVSIVYFVVCIPFLLAQNQTYTDRYDLRFESNHEVTTKQSWRFDATSFSSSLIMTSVENGKPCLNFFHPEGYPFANRLKVACEQRILLPDQNENVGKILLESKGENLEYCEMIVRGIDSSEIILYADTLRFSSGKLLKRVSLDFSLMNVAFLDIKLEAEGVKDKEASFCVFGINISLGKIPIDEFPLKEYNQYVEMPKDKLFPLNSDEDLGQLDALIEKRIIGLGESVHGNKNIANLFFELSKHQILKNGCRLIIHEIPLELSLYCNRYIRDSSYEFDEVYFLGPEFASLLKWLRTYNEHKKEEQEKVYLLGMDYVYNRDEKNSTAATVFDYLASLNRTIHSQEIDTLLVTLLEEPWEKSVAYMTQRRAVLERLISSVDFRCITHILTLSNAKGLDRNKRMEVRDSVMFQNANFLISQICPKDANVLIYGHSEHLNLLSCYPVATPDASFGAMMHRFYKDDYYSITTLIGSGYVYLPDVNGVESCWNLCDPPASSIERELCKIKEGMFFIPVPFNYDKPLLSRFVGQLFTKQEFYPYNLYRRHHGLIFIRGANNKMSMDEKSKIKLSLSSFKRKRDERKVLLEKVKCRIINNL